MGNIFKKQQEVNEHPNRNNFDLSFKSNVSMKFGTLYPVFCKPVVPGDSFSIDTAFNLKLQPVVFPVQTKMRAHMHYFYVRNKNLWENWENWISNLVTNTEHPHPYISVSDSKIKSGSIHDFLGVPTTVVTDAPTKASFSVYSQAKNKVQVFWSPFETLVPNASSQGDDFPMAIYYDFRLPFSTDDSLIQFGVYFPNVFTKSGSHPSKFGIAIYEYSGDFLTGIGTTPELIAFSDENTLTFKPLPDESYVSTLDLSTITFDNMYLCDTISEINARITNNHKKIAIGVIPFYEDYTGVSGSETPLSDVLLYTTISTFGYQQYSDLGLKLYSENLHINALPYRAYESIYYAYYNNSVLNPLKIGGQVQYNRYNTNLGDGADTVDYHLFQRNYELDFLTSSLPSPQQGVAPVVGMTALGDVTIEDENGITTAHAQIDDDGTITKVVLTSPAASLEHARTAMNIAACGMSINDFRATNALQRFLETSIRKGYKYRDFIAGHFGKEPEYRELDMAEFIGGFSRDVSVSTVVSNADTITLQPDDSTTGAALGQYGGFAQVVGGSLSSIRHYCDDYGYIIGILSVVPTPCYSQLLPKHMIAPNNFLDYYFNEFANLGMQPVTYKEVAPIQSYVDGLSDPSKSLEDTFGYQRPNYDLISSVDELHGDFRGSLKDWVINRIFDTRPELGQSFISINPDEINDIFVDTNPDEDTIIGEIGFSVHAKRPIPRVVIPNLGK